MSNLVLYALFEYLRFGSTAIRNIVILTVRRSTLVICVICSLVLLTLVREFYVNEFDAYHM